MASRDNQALSSAEKALYANSSAVTVNFAKTMIATRVGAVSLYFAAVTFLVGDKGPASPVSAVLLLAPALGCLLAMGSFTVAYAPRHKDMLLDVPADGSNGVTSVSWRRELWRRASFWPQRRNSSSHCG